MDMRKAVLTVISGALLGLTLGSNGALGAGMSASEIRIGQSAILSGPIGAFTQEYIDGANVVFNRVNQQGGIFGRSIKLTIKDNQFDAKKGGDNATELIDKHDVFLLFGTGGTGPSNELIKVAAQRGVPVFAPYTGADHLRDLPGNNFFLRASYSAEVREAVRHFVAIGYSAVAIVYQDDAYGKPIAEAAKKQIADSRARLVRAVPIGAKHGAFAGEIQRLRESAPEITLVIAAGTLAVDVLKKIKASGIRTGIYSNSVINATLLRKELGANAAGIVLSQVTPNPWRSNNKLVSIYKKHIPDRAAIGYAHFEGYLSAQTLVRFLEKCGRSCSREKFVALVRSGGEIDLGGYVLRFSKENNSASSFVDLAIINSLGAFTN
jgi:branched-chain amino acid transport system substrate-binding protein